MKIEVGMYVRLKKGKVIYVRKLLEVIHHFEIFDVYRTDKEYFDFEEKDYFDIIYPDDILKASDNIIDLIEENDVIVVDGIKYTVLKNKKYFDGTFYIERITQEGCPRFTSLSHLIYDNKIQSIVTKEQLEREKYVIGE